MADYTWCTVTTSRRIYSLPSPTNWGELGKVLAAIQQDADLTSTSDDAVIVEAWDDEIRLSFEIKS